MRAVSTTKPVFKTTSVNYSQTFIYINNNNNNNNTNNNNDNNNNGLLATSKIHGSSCSK